MSFYIWENLRPESKTCCKHLLKTLELVVKFRGKPQKLWLMAGDFYCNMALLTKKPVSLLYWEKHQEIMEINRGEMRETQSSSYGIKLNVPWNKTMWTEVCSGGSKGVWEGYKLKVLCHQLIISVTEPLCSLRRKIHIIVVIFLAKWKRNAL